MLLLETVGYLVDLVHRPHLVERKPHDAALLSNGLEDALAYPPHGIGDELETPGFVEFFRGLDKSQVALVDEVGQTQPFVLILLCHRDNETEVGLGQLLQGFTVTLSDALSQLHFLFYRDEFFVSYLL